MNRQFGGVMVAVLGVALLIGGLKGTWRRAMNALVTDLHLPEGAGGSGSGGSSPPANTKPTDDFGGNGDLVCPANYSLVVGQCYANVKGLPSPIAATHRPTTSGIPAGAAGSYVKTA